MKLKKILIMIVALFLIAISFIGCDEWSSSDKSSPHGNKDNTQSQNSPSDTKNEEKEGELLEGLIDLRPAKLSDDKAILYVKNGQDKDGDGKYWSVNVEMLSEGTSTLLTLTGTNDYEWSPQGLFGNQGIGEYGVKVIGMWVKANANATLTLKGMSANWKRMLDQANAQTLKMNQWTYVEFNLANLPNTYYYLSNIISDVRGTMLIDGFSILDEPTLNQEVDFVNGKTSSDLVRRVVLSGFDADGDGTLWAVDSENFSYFKNVLFALSGAAAYNVNHGEEGNWCPNGILGVETLGENKTKYIGMYVYATSDTRFYLAGMNKQLEYVEFSEIEQTVDANTWMWIEFDLSVISEEYQYISCLVADTTGSFRVDSFMMFER